MEYYKYNIDDSLRGIIKVLDVQVSFLLGVMVSIGAFVTLFGIEYLG